MAEEKRPIPPGAPPQWRFEYVSNEPVPKPFLPDEDYLDRVWLELQLLHTAFRGVDQAEYWGLVRRLHDIELIFLDREELDTYYNECYRDEKTIHETLHRDGFGSAHRTRETDKVAGLQAQFMEDVFYVLQLNRYGNAPDNRGWMNLLRRWGRSPTFNARFAELRSTFTEEFVAFYKLYLRNQTGTMEEVALPHPWDRPPRWDGVTPIVGPGIFLDSGIREVARKRKDSRTGERPVPQPGSGGHGVSDEKGGSLMYETPPPASDPDSEGSPPGGLTNA
jgi:hypothetical protein